MTIKAVLVVGAAALGVAAVLFQVKVQVVGIERELARLRQEIEDDFWKIRSLEAEVAHLTLPDRVTRLAQTLAMEPGRVERILTIDELGFADHLRLAGQKLQVDIDEGARIELLFRPMPTVVTRRGHAP